LSLLQNDKTGLKALVESVDDIKSHFDQFTLQLEAHDKVLHGSVKVLEEVRDAQLTAAQETIEIEITRKKVIKEQTFDANDEAVHEKKLKALKKPAQLLKINTEHGIMSGEGFKTVYLATYDGNEIAVNVLKRGKQDAKSDCERAQ